MDNQEVKDCLPESHSDLQIWKGKALQHKFLSQNLMQ